MESIMHGSVSSATSRGGTRNAPEHPAARADVSQPRVCVATRWFGVRSQVWMWRQVRLFNQVEPSILSWTYENPNDYPIDDTPIRLVGTAEEPNDGRGRWWWRLRNLPKGNFYATQGAEENRLSQLVRELHPDVLLCHFGQFGLRLLPIAEQQRIPVVVHFHGVDISANLRVRYYRWSLRRNLNRFAAAVCVGTHQRDKLIELGMEPSRVHLIPCGVPTQEFMPVQRDTQRPVTFICVSRLVKWKGVHHSIAAFARIAPQLPGSRLIVAGDGGELPNLKQQARELGVAERIEFVGALPPSGVRRLLEQADVFLQHSLTYRTGWSEGFGVSIAEAAATGLPVVVSDCGGITEQVVDGVTGIVVPECDEAAMARAMLTLAEDAELRKKMGEAGRQRMVERFDTTQQVRKLEHVLLSAVGRTELNEHPPAVSSGGKW